MPASLNFPITRPKLAHLPGQNCLFWSSLVDKEGVTTIKAGNIALNWPYMCYLWKRLRPGRLLKIRLACFLNWCKKQLSVTGGRTKSPETDSVYRDHYKGTSACCCRTAGGADTPTGQRDPDSDQLEWLLERSVQAGQPGSGSLRFCARAFIRNGVASLSPLSSAFKQIQTLKGSSRVLRGCL